MYLRGIILALFTAALTVLPTPTPAQAVCTTALAGQEVVAASSTVDSATEKSVTVGCPTGTRVICIDR